MLFLIYLHILFFFRAFAFAQAIMIAPLDLPFNESHSCETIKMWTHINMCPYRSQYRQWLQIVLHLPEATITNSIYRKSHARKCISASHTHTHTHTRWNSGANQICRKVLIIFKMNLNTFSAEFRMASVLLKCKNCTQTQWWSVTK